MSKIKCPICDPSYQESHAPLTPGNFNDPNTSYECQGTSVFDEAGKLISHIPCGEKWKHPKKAKPKGRKDKK